MEYKRCIKIINDCNDFENMMKNAPDMFKVVGYGYYNSALVDTIEVPKEVFENVKKTVLSSPCVRSSKIDEDDILFVQQVRITDTGYYAVYGFYQATNTTEWGNHLLSVHSYYVAEDDIYCLEIKEYYI